MRRIARIVLICSLLGASLFATAPPTEAHGTGCQLTGSLGFKASPGGPTGWITGWARYRCDQTHYRSSAHIILQQYYGGWRNMWDSGQVNDCCNKFAYTVYTNLEPCLVSNLGPAFHWRIHVVYWYLYNANGSLTPHTRTSVNVGDFYVHCGSEDF
jgi:hypothetical protein